MKRNPRKKKASKPEPEGELIQRVRRRLSASADFTEKRMFGATAFLVTGKLCVTARRERLMCRVDPRRHDELIDQPGVTAVTMGGRLYRGYLHITAESVATEPALRKWLDLALQHNRAQRRS